MNLINGFLTISGQIQIDLNLGSPGIKETPDGYLIELPDMVTKITLKQTAEGYSGELTSRGMGASVLFFVKDVELFLAALKS